MKIYENKQTTIKPTNKYKGNSIVCFSLIQRPWMLLCMKNTTTDLQS